MLRLRRLLLICLASFVILFVFHKTWLRSAANWLDVSDARFPADYVVILPGGANTRVFAAAAIAKANLVENLIVIENLASPDVADGVRSPNHEITKRVLLSRGVSADRIITLSGESSTTFSDVQMLGDFLADKADATVAVVTNRYHTRRARWTMHRVLGARANQFSYVPIPDDAFDWNNWWKSDIGARAITSEYLKLAYYVVQASSLTMRALAVVATGLFFFVSYRVLGYQRRRDEMIVNGRS